MADGTIQLKRGEKLFEEGKSIDSLYVIQSGRVSAFVERSGKKTELFQVGPPQVFGEEALFGGGKFGFTVEATNAVQILKVPIAVFKKQIDESSAGNKILFKSLSEEVKRLRSLLRSQKMENEAVPCPEMLIPRVFGGIAIAGQHVGKSLIEDLPEGFESKSPLHDGSSRQIGWSQLKVYSTRFFMESPNRILNALQILANLDYVELFYIKNEDEEDELDNIYIHKPQEIEHFADFFQYHLYKPGRSEIIYPEKMATLAANSIVEFSKESQPDFRGVTRIEYSSFLDFFKSRQRAEFNNTYLNLLEKKGLFLQRKNTDQGLFLEFNRDEYIEAVQNWKFLEQIKIWNETGRVAAKVIEAVVEEGAANSCPDCGAEVSGVQKFCSECGYKLVA
ncbi:MAG: cyclic nucleotide-binding domain-containing protein [Bdellovibrionales bacterium]|nr:cyclic nucleotide-binding domain-containing protein [Bdellovibrionales bacterium]